MSILVYDGLRELIKREFTDRNMATTDNTVNAAVSLIETSMKDYRSKALQLVGTELPSTGVAGTIYLQSKSEPNEKNRFIAYVFENGKFVQVGSSFFPEDFEHDSELNINSKITVENKAIKTVMDSKYDLSKVINNVVYNDANSIHADDTPTSSAIKAALDAKLGYEDGSPISKVQLWQIFRPKKARLVYPYINVVPLGNGGGDGNFECIRLENKNLLSNLKYKSGLENNPRISGTYIVTFIDLASEKDIRVRVDGNGGNYAQWYDGFFNADVHPAEYRLSIIQRYGQASFEFKFLDPIPIGVLDDLIISLRTQDGVTGGYNSTVFSRYLKITTKISDSGVDTDYTTIQNEVIYNNNYTDGIPFYGFNN